LESGRDLQCVAVALKEQGKLTEAKKEGKEAVRVMTMSLGRQHKEVTEATKMWA
jgi:hypothetical protein